MRLNFIPKNKYGVLIQDKPKSEYDEIAEQVRRLGYAILDSGYSKRRLRKISEIFNATSTAYLRKFKIRRLAQMGEHNAIRAPLVHGGSMFINLATNPRLLAVLKRLIPGKYILNQQNGVINPPRESYSQGAWHRDLPYQHFVCSSPIAVNALFCVDAFTEDNGSTFVLPASHRSENFPSDSFVRRNALQITANAGQYIVLDCMLFHGGGFNDTATPRRAVNHVFTIPFFKQQIALPNIMDQSALTAEQREIFGMNCHEPASVEEFLSHRAIQSKKSRGRRG